MVQWERIILPMQETQDVRVWSLGLEDPLRREWQPTPVFLPGKFHRQRRLIGCRPWGHKESDTTEWLNTWALIFKDFTKLVTILLPFHVLTFWLLDMWGPSSLTRDQILTLCIGRWSFNHRTTREVPALTLNVISSLFLFWYHHSQSQPAHTDFIDS